MAPEQDVDHDVTESSDDVRRVRRGSGPRATLRRENQQRAAVRVFVGVIVLGIALVIGPRLYDAGRELLAGLGDDAPTTAEPDAAEDEVVEPVADADLRPTVLVATYDDAGEAVTGVQLFSLEAETGRGAVVLVPTTMVADVPGYGLLPVGDAGEFGGVPLLELTIENQLGIAIDATVRVSEQDWAALFSRVGGFEVDVTQPLEEAPPSGATSRRFEAGPQFLDGPRLAELLTFELAGEDELTSFARVRQVLEGFLRVAGTDDALDAVFEDGAPMLTMSDVEVVERTLRGLASPEANELVVLRTLPVTVLSSGDGVFYRLDDSRATEFVNDVLGGTEQVVEVASDGLRLEILNGNGAAGIGADVAALLVPLGHTVAITRNAENFDHPTTRVLLNRDDDDLVAAGQEIIDTLGVGRIEVSQVSSSIVDITVLVGADFRR
jgi:anionic cell wall polymer biosynthesis LytR-Cps2A-Psr (LCP) family protein